MTPLVRKLASENGIDLNTLKGTGVGGRIRKQDVAGRRGMPRRPPPRRRPRPPRPLRLRPRRPPCRPRRRPRRRRCVAPRRR
ncbi:E3 binding domain-containing protein [Kutzneria kofuensis]|uniref:E3 binding domain-containing protein n=1 Tax=Kutzneria kofuensis TaxID=103725 RepID=UPI0031E9A78C